MAEYKYRALGWKDDDIASLNVVDGTADNQVELQITKQGAGTIDGPAIIGKDGITINKAADSEKIEISGSGLVPRTSEGTLIDVSNIYVPIQRMDTHKIDWRLATSLSTASTSIMMRDNDGHSMVEEPVSEKQITNKKYVDDNYVKKIEPISSNYQLYGVNTIGEYAFPVDNSSGQIGAISKFWQPEVGANQVEGYLLTNTPTLPYQCANKKYVDDAVSILTQEQVNSLF